MNEDFQMIVAFVFNPKTFCKKPIDIMENLALTKQVRLGERKQHFGSQHQWNIS